MYFKDYNVYDFYANTEEKLNYGLESSYDEECYFTVKNDYQYGFVFTLMNEDQCGEDVKLISYKFPKILSSKRCLTIYFHTNPEFEIYEKIQNEAFKKFN